MAFPDCPYFVGDLVGFQNWFRSRPLLCALIIASGCIVFILAVQAFELQSRATRLKSALARIRVLGMFPSSRLTVLGQFLPGWLVDRVPFEYFHELSSLDAEGVGIHDSDLTLLRDLPSLETLNLDCPNISDVAIDEISRLHIRHLSLGASRISGAGYQKLAGMSSVENLWLPPQITDHDLQAICCMRQLVLLSLNHARISNVGISGISSLTNLRELSLYNTLADDSCMEVLGRLPKLVKLRLDFTKITDAGLIRFGSLRRLEVLSLDGCDVSGQGLVELRNSNVLQELMLGSERISDEDVELLCTLVNLAKLDLSSARIGDSSVSKLSGLSRLKSLNLRDTMISKSASESLHLAIPNADIVGK